MAVHVVAMGKLKLLAGGHSNWQLLAALLGPFALKLPFATRLPTSCADLAFSLRLFLFRLHRIFFADAAYGASTRSDSRWERALRLFHARAIADDRPFGMQLQANEEMLNALAMLAL
ncbi:hypothetical protein COCNU_07G005730 [Cocos nucifera]|uniref:Uncharacterized protein n=1 Tax=Cocos nucifera TaxID=13894 RepID=A0A8K0IEQ3_COCNU|nr:hypothetical protein COCNU_07G005730 [Cocos nucifera]